MKIKNLKSAYFVGMYLFVAAIMTATAGYGSSTNGTNGMVQKPAPPPLDSATPALSGYQLYPGQQILPGTTPPTGLPFTYTVTITDTTGTWTTTTTVSCFQKEFVTNISPAGTETGTVVFRWAGINDPNALYGVELNDSNGNRVWRSDDISGTAIGYTGPPLIQGMTYRYLVLVESSSTCNNQGSSFVSGRFTYQ